MAETDRSQRTPLLGGIILAGGAARRMGADKAQLRWNGRRAVDLLADRLADLRAQPVLVSGGDYGLPFVPDPIPGAGPVAGLKTALAALESAGCVRALVLAVDAPTVSVDDLAPLVESDAPGACYAGLPLPMSIFLAALPSGVADDAPLRGWVAAAGLKQLPLVPEQALRLRGANTPAEREALLTEAFPDGERPS